MLRLGDGLNRQRPDLKYEVKHLQRLLQKLQFKLEDNGVFDERTNSSVRKFQQQHSLSVDGVVGDATWQALEKVLLNDEPHPEPAVASPSRVATDTTDFQSPLLADFRGDTAWIHEQEGHAGRAYWPGGKSGVTLDPGFDLGQNLFQTFKNYYADILTSQTIEALRPSIGKSGRSAKNWLNRSREALAIRINRSQANTVFPYLLLPYWINICKLSSSLSATDTPASVQTALLSLAYNRGPFNPDLQILKSPIANKDWHECATLIGKMQQDHSLRGIRLRRQREAKLILDSVL